MTTPVYKPVLTEDGNAIQMQDGWPLVETPKGDKVPWDIGKQAGALSDANTEAKTRRTALETMAQAVGLTVDVRTSEGLEALRSTVAAFPADAEELKTLRAAKAAGELDETADDKIKAAAAKLDQAEKAQLLADAKAANKARAEAETASQRATAQLNAAMTRQGIEAFYDRARADKEGKMPAFLPGSRRGFVRAALEGDGNGHRWTWNGKRDDDGVPIVVLADTATDEVVKGPDNLDALSLGHWAKETLQKSDPYLFKPQDGSTGVDKFGAPAAQSFGEMGIDDIDAAARQQAG